MAERGGRHTLVFGFCDRFVGCVARVGWGAGSGYSNSRTDCL